MRTESKTNFQRNKTLPGESGAADSTHLPVPGTVNSDPGRAYFMTYQEQIKNPKWQKKRLYELERAKYTCEICESTDKQLHVHHIIYYKNRMIWDYDAFELLVLCEDCHKNWHDGINEIISKIAYLNTNYKDEPLTINKILTLLDYYEFEADDFNELLKKAKEYKYPWL